MSDGMVRLLDIGKGGDGVIMVPTMRLRVLVPRYPSPIPRIQQWWHDIRLDIGEWRDVDQVTDNGIPNPSPV